MTRDGAMTVGYQGFGNLGDEAILTGIEQLLAGGTLEVRTVAGGSQPIPAFPDAQRVPTRGLLPTLVALRALRRRRALLVAGGGLLHDHWPIVVPSYLAWSLLARLSGARVAWVAVGIGPLRHWWSRRMAGLTLRLASVVTVRDPASADLAQRVAPGVPIRIVPDPAVFNAPPPSAGPREGIGVVVRGPAPAERDRTGELAGALGALAAHLDARRPVVLMTLAGAADEAFAQAVAASATTHGGRRPDVEQLPADPATCLVRLAELEALVSVRLHGVILGALAGTPVVGIAYDPKVAAWCELLGTPATDLDALAPDHVLALLDAATDDAARRRVASRVEELRARRDDVRGALEAVLG